MQLNIHFSVRVTELVVSAGWQKQGHAGHVVPRTNRSKVGLIDLRKRKKRKRKKKERKKKKKEREKKGKEKEEKRVKRKREKEESYDF